MSPASPGFLRRLFLRPALWVAMLPGMALALLDSGCSGYQPVISKSVCDLDLLSLLTLGSSYIFWGIDAVLYVGLRAVDIKQSWNETHRIAWISEIALLVIGEYLVFYTVAFVAFAMMKGI